MIKYAMIKAILSALAVTAPIAETTYLDTGIYYSGYLLRYSYLSVYQVCFGDTRYCEAKTEEQSEKPVS